MKLSDCVLEPLQVEDYREFPLEETLPDGCIEVDAGFEDSFGYEVHYFEKMYAERDGMQLHLHIYQPQLTGFVSAEENKNKRWPAIVFVPGSAFHKQDMFEHTSWLVRFAGRGYLMCAVEYRPSEVAPFPAQEEDCKTAVRFVKKHAEELRCDPEHIGLWGDSSGGHTVLMAGFTGDGILDTDLYGEYSSAVQCIIDWYGPTDFAKMNLAPSSQNHIEADSPEGYEIGHKNVLENPELANAASPMTYLCMDKAVPPLMIVHGGRDMLVPFSQSVLLYEKMRELNKDVSFIKIRNANHGIGGFSCDRMLDLMQEFLEKKL